MWWKKGLKYFFKISCDEKGTRDPTECNIQRKQYQHTETAYFKHVDVFHASRHSEKKTKLGEDGGKLRR